MINIPAPELSSDLQQQIDEIEAQSKLDKLDKAARTNKALAYKKPNVQKIERSQSYAQNILFGLAYLYIHLKQAARAEQYLRTLCVLERSHKPARILLAVCLVMQGKKISADLFAQIRQSASPDLVMMFAKRL